MNYYDARQVDPNSDRQDAGKWRYTGMNDDYIWPTGACALDCEGHDTKQEAYDHQKKHMLNNMRVRDDMTGGESLHKCSVDECENYTRGGAEVDSFRVFFLCRNHRKPEHAAKLFQVGYRISSC